VVATAVGNASLAFSDGNHGTFSYSLDGVRQTKPDHAAGHARARHRLPVTTGSIARCAAMDSALAVVA
jgi:hypothetical protein